MRCATRSARLICDSARSAAAHTVSCMSLKKAFPCAGCAAIVATSSRRQTASATVPSASARSVTDRPCSQSKPITSRGNLAMVVHIPSNERPPRAVLRTEAPLSRRQPTAPTFCSWTATTKAGSFPAGAQSRAACGRDAVRRTRSALHSASNGWLSSNFVTALIRRAHDRSSSRLVSDAKGASTSKTDRWSRAYCAHPAPTVSTASTSAPCAMR
mmetsp:Transcript_25530/g.66834  ORF Transcript_25530/g.66834 Transcript_25530/m.66834 type:complete len:214 (+) Transcript_25530:3647-4288(+)